MQEKGPSLILIANFRYLIFYGCHVIQDGGPESNGAELAIYPY